ncbi:MAG: ERCC4 domain-containing protein [Candidatus Paceibacterota bacterium]|jgi:ERCC4-type nuclease
MIKALGSVAVPMPLQTGDCAFFGVSDTDTALRICVERKKIGDIAQCINDGRYIHQAQSAKDAEFDVLCLIAEGRIRCNPDDGLLEVPVWGISHRTMRRCEMYQPVKPAMQYSRFDQFLTELDYLAGIIVKRSEDVRETACIIKSLYANFQTAPSKHGSLKQIYEQPIGHVLLTRPSLLRRMAKELSGIGWERSRTVSEYFKSVREMANADAKCWQGIEGIGKKTAEKVIKELNGGKG